MIKGNESDLESRLNLMNVSLSIASMTQIFQVLNSKKVCALRFFHWSRQSQPEFYRNCDICSLIVDNCGRRDDLGAMLCVLNDFRLSKVYLTQKAFGFLPAMVLSKALTEKSLSRVIDVLNKVGGSCAVSGFRALIEMLCVVGCFELAQFVIKKAGRKVSYYNILIRGMCLRCDFEGARKLLDEMRHVGCDPNAQSYNFILGVLSRTDKIAEAREVFEDMLERGYLPNAITFEILIYGMLRHSNLDIACEFLDRMTSFGIEPRLTTHAAFIRNYFAAQKYEEAYNYVVVSGEKYRQASNMMYSMLARLHRNKGNLSLSVNILFEMINKGLKPYFPDYIKALKHLWKSGRIDLARDLEKRFSSLSLQPTTNTA
ncbi:PPR domain-containing protein/PPR_2 domain-containing protein [Cephalotus follicularis]|uniref:PPR domain-containing protein/PPR_2 domain-containing protein n=1 Tax=Cephalotus follicularis TaxID=3775 RepID=A0A1Q3BRE4_CEPFO|nr:PPR domain-containing protein/PPR_2 domain-containing protein [Cephalotus follicularis]